MQSTASAGNKRFMAVFTHAAMETLFDLGPSVQEAVLFHMEKILGVSPANVFNDTVKFSQALEKIFSSGAALIEGKILQSMSRELRLPYEKTEGSFELKLAVLMEEAKLNSPPPTFQLGALEQSMR